MYNDAPTIEEFEAAVLADRINKSEDDNYVLYKYTKQTVYSRDWDKITLYSRGIIFDKLTGECVAIPFKKFFNLDETECDMSAFPVDPNYEILEKMDGSMGCIFLTRDNELRVATPGSFLSEQAIWATKFLRRNSSYDAIKQKFIDGDVTVMVVEIICDLSRVVVNYDFEGFVVIAAQGFDNKYMCYEDMKDLCEEIDWAICRKFTFKTVDDIKKFLDTVEDFEGFVLHWPDTGYRIKMKGEDYCIKHRIISRIHPNRIDEAIENAGDTLYDIYQSIDETLSNFPEEFAEPYKVAFGDFKYQMGMVISKISFIVSSAQKQNNTAKDLAVYLKSGDDHFHKTYFAHIMNAFNGRERVKKLVKMIWKDVRDKHFKNVEEENE
jgi:RNA ligase